MRVPCKTPAPGCATLLQDVLTFTVIAAVAVISPGADTLLVIRSVVARGVRAGLMTTVGICAGCTVHATLSAIGVSVLVMQSAWAYQVLTAAGAMYLGYLGVMSLRSAAQRTPNVALDLASPLPSQHDFRNGFIVNVLNPKVSLFYLALVPQFVPSTASILMRYALLSGIHIALGALWFTTLSYLLDRARPWLLSSSTRRLLDAVAGAIMLALALHIVARS
jgi:threonine/homoserine/homoserine lactone efflux protein